MEKKILHASSRERKHGHTINLHTTSTARHLVATAGWVHTSKNGSKT